MMINTAHQKENRDTSNRVIHRRLISANDYPHKTEEYITRMKSCLRNKEKLQSNLVKIDNFYHPPAIVKSSRRSSFEMLGDPIVSDVNKVEKL